MIFDRAVRAMTNSVQDPGILTLTGADSWVSGLSPGSRSAAAMKLSTVNRCVACITDSMSKLPVYVFNNNSKERPPNHPLAYLLGVRPNEAMTPSVYKKLMEANRLLKGNGYAAIVRSGRDGRPIELLPLSADCCTPVIDPVGTLWYVYTNPRTGEMRKLHRDDVLHYKAYTEDGILGISVLSHARDVIRNEWEKQRYEGKFYSQNAQPGGVLTVDADLKKESKDKIREEWEKIHSGVDKAFRIAILDLGLKYTPISINNRDAQFVESKRVSVEDIARFFGVPLYKLGAGKQSYNSNEQNGIEYVVETLHPIVTQYDEEDSYKLLFDIELHMGLWVQRNMMAELKGDAAARGAWYKTMREIGVYSSNDICQLEDLPDVPGGDTRYASLNYVPLERFDELSVLRANSKGGSQ